ncbi:rhomboid family intramembrane serine protease [Gilvimarinus agarilyticus]|uniref:rhomboid family intramembrane serine protease n=1 Tax=Gilvimarinus sp. 2_MG-2023 TaxID=3062666 RepID=UPI001C091EA7|nr:rhomboid family intramembrane serine protease [Gilvimarinus sp. 2_MG-2023]MBU2887146.1 rhomboid family intramembrane serine protease [Gilvimarinus agarilyticus]MDO6571805.1 rhomboid family intramembrane serine protease [Gilvimarinus sp. 2_MG-2023]
MSWIPIQSFPIDRDLTDLVENLRSGGVNCRVIERNGEQVLFLDPAQQEAGRAILQRWEQGDYNNAPRSQTSLWHGLSLHQLAQTPVTAILLILSLAGYFVSTLPALQHWQFVLTLVPIEIVSGRWLAFGELSDSLGRHEYWRLVTPAFLHFSILHLVFNGLWTWELGRRIEVLKGTSFAMGFFMVAAISGNLLQYYWSPEPSLLGGMSGVVYAYLGFLAVSHALKPHPLTAIPRGILMFMLIWLAIGFTGVIDFAISGSVANAAHLGGLIAGVSIAAISLLFDRFFSEQK